MNQEHKEKLCEIVEGTVQFDVSLAPLTSFNIGGPADCFVIPAHLQDLQRVLVLLGEWHLPYVVMGNGTNLLIRDRGIRGAVVRLKDGFRNIGSTMVTSGVAELSGGAAVPLDALVKFCIDQGLSGIEALSGIPGSLGGALKMNAGAFGCEMKDVAQRISYLLPDGSLKTVSGTAMPFSYRSLSIPQDAIIVEALLALNRAETETLRKTREEILQKRHKLYTPQYPCAGSIFKNPPGHSAGQLIEEVGLKGMRIGGAQISQEHGNFILNLGAATAQDVMNLMRLAGQRVKERSGVTLEPEICIIGDA